MQNYFSHIEKKYCAAAAALFAMCNRPFRRENEAPRTPQLAAAWAIQSPLSITARPSMRDGWIS
jgi:hypothetical protein